MALNLGVIYTYTPWVPTGGLIQDNDRQSTEVMDTPSSVLMAVVTAISLVESDVGK